MYMTKLFTQISYSYVFKNLNNEFIYGVFKYHNYMVPDYIWFYNVNRYRGEFKRG